LAAPDDYSIKPSLASPQRLGTSVTWEVLAQDSNPGPLTFQFNVAVPGLSLSLVKDFNVGRFPAGRASDPPEAHFALALGAPLPAMVHGWFGSRPKLGCHK
jgi:hypothetical protein